MVVSAVAGSASTPRPAPGGQAPVPLTICLSATALRYYLANAAAAGVHELRPPLAEEATVGSVLASKAGAAIALEAVRNVFEIAQAATQTLTRKRR